MKRCLFLGTMICAFLLLAVAAFAYPNPAAAIPQDNTSVSVTSDVSPPELGMFNVTTAMTTGISPPVTNHCTDTAIPTTFAEFADTGIYDDHPQSTATKMNNEEVLAFTDTGPTTSPSNGPAHLALIMRQTAVDTTEGDVAIPAPIVRCANEDVFREDLSIQGFDAGSVPYTKSAAMITNKRSWTAMVLRC